MRRFLFQLEVGVVLGDARAGLVRSGDLLLGARDARLNLLRGPGLLEGRGDGLAGGGLILGVHVDVEIELKVLVLVLMLDTCGG